jgi:hypothetical protein
VTATEGGLCRVTVRERTGRGVPHHGILVLECLLERFNGAAIPRIEQAFCGEPTDLGIVVRQEVDQGEDGPLAAAAKGDGDRVAPMTTAWHASDLHLERLDQRPHGARIAVFVAN